MFSVLTLCLNLLISNTAVAEDATFFIRLRLLKPIVTTEVHPLSFPDTVVGTDSDITVNASNNEAALIDVTGTANANITGGVVESSITMTAPGSDTPVRVDNFIVNTPSALNNSGKGNIGVGATAHMLASNDGGTYNGTATLRVVYQ
ncbi:MAG: DUF4402 domain-containing protein [Pseudomonadota bacterium]